MENKYITYVLYSEKFDRIYIGQTSDLERRIKEHNSGESRFTKTYLPWKIIYKEEFLTRSQSMKREKELKCHKGREFIRAILNGGVRQLPD